jgi:16S rRNA G966 N2-methylase RsmD
MEIFNADCLEKMKDLIDDSIDLIFCDLPYGQTSCKWDCKIDLDLFWKEIMRIKKTNTPIFFTTTTKFGVELITTAPKKCPFRYDIVWLKSAPVGFLSAKKMPMRKHEMLYVFYEKLPFYDLSSHKHKFLKPQANRKGTCYNKEGSNSKDSKIISDRKTFEPPLPVSVVKEDVYTNGNRKGGFGGEQKGLGTCYQDPALISSQDVHKKNGLKSIGYEPPLPVSVVKEDIDEKYKNKGGLYSKISRNGLVKNEPHYEPPLPTTALEIKSTKGKHSTEKPVALMEWILKYYSKEGDVVLDPTMGSGSTGIACKNMKRAFIGIEKDKEIFKVAEDRLK